MTAARSRAQIGKANNAKGKDSERKTAAFLRHHGFPDAERMQRTGWRNRQRSRADCGDLAGIHPLVCQVKTSATMSDLDVRAALAATADQCVAAGGDYGFLVQRRSGKGDVGLWWGWITVGDFLSLNGLDVVRAMRGMAGASFDNPIRLHLATLVTFFRRNGYGQPLPEEERG